MVRTAALNSFHRRILRFGTPDRSGAPGAFYAALWRLPRPDFHRLANDDFKAHEQNLGYFIYEGANGRALRKAIQASIFSL